MADFDLGGLLGNLFGGGESGSELEKLLSAKQREQLGMQSTLSAAAALLKAGGRGPQRIGLGQALGSALEAGQGAYEKGTTGAFNQLMLGEKIKEMQREAAGNEAWQKYLKGEGQPPPLTPAQAALAAPVSAAGPVGPTMARAQLAEQMPVPSAVSTDPLAFLNPVQRTLIAGMPRKEGMPEVLKAAAAQAEFGKPEPMMVNGQVKMMQFNKLGQSKEYTGAKPYEAPSQDLRTVEYISGENLAGTGPRGIKAIGEYRSQIAPKTQVDVKLPGNQQFLAGVGGDVSKTLNELTMGARSANETLINIDRILPALDKAIVGPGADYRTAMLRIGQQLNVAGANANEQLANTRVVLQGLAQQELDAAGQMRGQGSIIGSERELLKRAASGDQTLSAAEITTALNTAQKVARYRLKLQEDYLQSASKLPGFEQFAPMYKVTPYGGGGGGSNPLLNAIDQQLQLRSSGGQR